MLADQRRIQKNELVLVRFIIPKIFSIKDGISRLFFVFFCPELTSKLNFYSASPIISIISKSSLIKRR